MQRTSSKDMDRTFFLWIIALLAMPVSSALAEDYVIKAHAMGDEIKLTASSDFGGSIISLTFRGQEYIDAADNGRELQSASTFDGLDECFNPTEAGGAYDKYKTSSSKVMMAKASGNVLTTQTNMAFWRKPGEAEPGGHCGTRSDLHVAQNTKILSNHLISKRVEIGCCGIANAISYDVTFKLPEHHTKARFEAVSLHTPPNFRNVYSFDNVNNKFNIADEKPIDTRALIFATKDGKNAIGLYCPNAKNDRVRTAFYGYILWPQTSVARCIFLEEPLNLAEYTYHGFVFVGHLDEVENSMQRLVHQTTTSSIPH
jgi:hypothetical protein